jgi:hypothetical protein
MPGDFDFDADTDPAPEKRPRRAETPRWVPIALIAAVGGAVLLAGAAVAAVVVAVGYVRATPPAAATTAAKTSPAAVTPIPLRPRPQPTPATPEPPADPWEEARAYFKGVQKTEKAITEAKLKSLDKGSEGQAGMLIRSYYNLAEPLPDLTDRLLAMGFNEVVIAHSAGTLDDPNFKFAFGKLNPTPTADQIIRGAINYHTTGSGTRNFTLKMLREGGNTRDYAETHKAARAWSGR